MNSEYYRIREEVLNELVVHLLRMKYSLQPNPEKDIDDDYMSDRSQGSDGDDELEGGDLPIPVARLPMNKVLVKGKTQEIVYPTPQPPSPKKEAEWKTKYKMGGVYEIAVTQGGGGLKKYFGIVKKYNEKRISVQPVVISQDQNGMINQKPVQTARPVKSESIGKEWDGKTLSTHLSA